MHARATDTMLSIMSDSCEVLLHTIMIIVRFFLRVLTDAAPPKRNLDGMDLHKTAQNVMCR